MKTTHILPTAYNGCMSRNVNKTARNYYYAQFWRYRVCHYDIYISFNKIDKNILVVAFLFLCSAKHDRRLSFLNLKFVRHKFSKCPVLESWTTLHGPISFPLEHNSFATVEIKLFEYEWKEFWIETRLRLFSQLSLGYAKCKIEYKKCSMVWVRHR